MKGYVKDKEGNILYKIDVPKSACHPNLNNGEEFILEDDLDSIMVDNTKQVVFISDEQPRTLQQQNGLKMIAVVSPLHRLFFHLSVKTIILKSRQMELGHLLFISSELGSNFRKGAI